MGVQLPSNLFDPKTVELLDQLEGRTQILEHSVILGAILTGQLIDDELRITINYQVFGTDGASEAEASNECLILSFVVGSLIVDVEGVLVHVTVWRYQDYTCTRASAV